MRTTCPSNPNRAAVRPRRHQGGNDAVTCTLAADCVLYRGGLVGGGLAQTYPSRPITLVAPFAAGSGVDVMARRIAADLSPRLGQPIIVENKPGAGSVIGAEFVAKAAPTATP